MNHGGRPKIYISQEAHTLWDVGNRIHHIFIDVDNRQVHQWASTVDMDGKHYDQVISIFINPGSNYIYVNVTPSSKIYPSNQPTRVNIQL